MEEPASMRSTPLCVFVCPATEELLVRKVTMWKKTQHSHFTQQKGVCVLWKQRAEKEEEEVDKWIEGGND